MNNKILVIKPQNINLLKTIYNYLLLDTLNIIIIGNKNDIKSKCETINLDLISFLFPIIIMFNVSNNK